jgi:hypothetical protein
MKTLLETSLIMRLSGGFRRGIKTMPERHWRALGRVVKQSKVLWLIGLLF